MSCSPCVLLSTTFCSFSVCVCVFVFHPFFLCNKKNLLCIKKKKQCFGLGDSCIVAIQIAFLPLDNKCVCAKFRVQRIVDTNCVWAPYTKMSWGTELWVSVPFRSWNMYRSYWNRVERLALFLSCVSVDPRSCCVSFNICIICEAWAFWALYMPLPTLMAYRQQSFGYSTLLCIAVEIDSLLYCFTCDFISLPVLCSHTQPTNYFYDTKMCKRLLNYECTTRTYAKRALQ